MKFCESQKKTNLIVNLSFINSNKFYLNRSINKNNRFTNFYSKTRLIGERITSARK